MKHYYGIYRAYGMADNGWPDGDGDGGGLGDVVCRFATKAERDTWVAEGPAYTTDAGSRDPLRAGSRTVRRVLAAPYDYFARMEMEMEGE